jgi:hypothetical protein
MKLPKDNQRLSIATELIEQRIYLIRGQKVMLDRDLADLYCVETKALNRAVRRNLPRFPADFMFQLTTDEGAQMRYQFGTASKRNVRFHPLAFTEHGTVMLASLLNSAIAIEASIQVVRAFVRLRSILAAHKELARKIEILEKSTKANFAEVFKFINAYLISKRELKPAIGFEIGRRKRKQ